MKYLSGTNLCGGYGNGPDILNNLDIGVDQGEIAVIVGPNGAGKSTAMKALLGLLPIHTGDVALNGTSIMHLNPQQRVEAGLAFVPQTNNVFVSMTVEENLEMGAYLKGKSFEETRDSVFELFPILAEKRRQKAGELSGGQRQQVAVGRAMMTIPKVLLLDEPTAGVSPVVMDELFERILAVKAHGIAVLMVEQNARQALEIADQGFVLVLGQNQYTNTGEALLADPEVRQVFLGG